MNVCMRVCECVYACVYVCVRAHACVGIWLWGCGGRLSNPRRLLHCSVYASVFIYVCWVCSMCMGGCKCLSMWVRGCRCGCGCEGRSPKFTALTPLQCVYACVCKCVYV